MKFISVSQNITGTDSVNPTELHTAVALKTSLVFSGVVTLLEDIPDATFTLILVSNNKTTTILSEVPMLIGSNYAIPKLVLEPGSKLSAFVPTNTSGKIDITLNITEIDIIDNPEEFDYEEFLSMFLADSPKASKSQFGLIQLASDADITSGTDSSKAITPLGLQHFADEKIPTLSQATEFEPGIMRIASAQDLVEGIDNSKAISPAGLAESAYASHSSGVIGDIVPWFGSGVRPNCIFTDGAEYPNASTLFPGVVTKLQSGELKSVPLTEYPATGDFGLWGYDEASDIVRAPRITTMIAGGATVDTLGQRVEAGLPNITADSFTLRTTENTEPTGCVVYGNSDYAGDLTTGPGKLIVGIDASLSSPIYGKSDTVTPEHVKCRWCVVVYSVAVPASVLQAQELINALSSKASINLDNLTAEATAFLNTKITDYLTPDFSRWWFKDYLATPEDYVHITKDSWVYTTVQTPGGPGFISIVDYGYTATYPTSNKIYAVSPCRDINSSTIRAFTPSVFIPADTKLIALKSPNNYSGAAAADARISTRFIVMPCKGVV